MRLQKHSWQFWLKSIWIHLLTCWAYNRQHKSPSPFWGFPFMSELDSTYSILINITYIHKKKLWKFWKNSKMDLRIFGVCHICIACLFSCAHFLNKLWCDATFLLFKKKNYIRNSIEMANSTLPFNALYKFSAKKIVKIKSFFI